MTQLDITNWGFLAVFGLLTGVTWCLAVRRRGKGRSRGGLVAALLLTVLLGADAVNSYFSDLPHVSDVVSAATGSNSWTGLDRADLTATNAAEALHEAPHGGVVRLVIPDRGSRFGPSTALVYLPPQYFTQPAGRFPVVYLLHGSPGTPADWIRGGGADTTGAALASRGQPAIIVMPKMSHHWLDDPECVDGIHLRDETHLLSDVLPTIDNTLRTLPDQHGRIIAGMSAGGFCALNLGLRHPELFGGIVDMSGLDRPTHSGGPAALFGRGPAATTAEAANDPSRYASQLPLRLPVRVWLDSGRSDSEVLAGLRRMRAVLESRGINVTLTLRGGSHTYHVWRPALRAALGAMIPRAS